MEGIIEAKAWQDYGNGFAKCAGGLAFLVEINDAFAKADGELEALKEVESKKTVYTALPGVGRGTKLPDWRPFAQWQWLTARLHEEHIQCRCL